MSDFYNDIMNNITGNSNLISCILKKGYTIKSKLESKESFFYNEKDDTYYVHTEKDKFYPIELDHISEEFPNILEKTNDKEESLNIYKYLYIETDDNIDCVYTDINIEEELFDLNYDISEKSIGTKVLYCEGENYDYLAIPYIKRIKTNEEFFSDLEKELQKENIENVPLGLKQGDLLKTKKQEIGSILIKIDKDETERIFVDLNEIQKIDIEQFRKILIKENSFEENLENSIFEESFALSLYKNLYVANLKKENDEIEYNSLDEICYFDNYTSIRFKENSPNSFILKTYHNMDNIPYETQLIDDDNNITDIPNQNNKQEGEDENGRYTEYIFESFGEYLNSSQNLLQACYDENLEKPQENISFYSYVLRSEFKEINNNLIQHEIKSQIYNLIDSYNYYKNKNNDKYLEIETKLLSFKNFYKDGTEDFLDKNNIKENIVLEVLEPEDYKNINIKNINELKNNYENSLNNLKHFSIDSYYLNVKATLLESDRNLRFRNIYEYYVQNESDFSENLISTDISNNSKFIEFFKQDFIDKNSDYYKNIFNDYIKDYDKKEFILSYLKSNHEFVYESEEIKKLRSFYKKETTNIDDKIKLKEVEIEILNYLNKEVTEISDELKLKNTLDTILTNKEFNLSEDLKIQITKKMDSELNQIVHYNLELYDSERKIYESNLIKEENMYNELLKIKDLKEIQKYSLDDNFLDSLINNKKINIADLLYDSNKENFDTFITLNLKSNREIFINAIEYMEDTDIITGQAKEDIIIEKKDGKYFFNNIEVDKEDILNYYDDDRQTEKTKLSFRESTMEIFEKKQSGLFLKNSHENDSNIIKKVKNNEIDTFNSYNDTQKYLSEVAQGKICLIKKVTNINNSPELYIIKEEEGKIYKQSISKINDINLSKITPSNLTDKNQIRLETEVLSLTDLKDFLDVYTGSDMHVTFKDYDYSVKNAINGSSKELKTLSKIVKDSNFINFDNKKNDFFRKLDELTSNSNKIAIFSTINKETEETKLFKFTKNDKVPNSLNLEVIIVPEKNKPPYSMKYENILKKEKILIDNEGEFIEKYELTKSSGVINSLVNELVMMDDQRDILRNEINKKSENYQKLSLENFSQNFNTLYDYNKINQSIHKLKDLDLDNVLFDGLKTKKIITENKELFNLVNNLLDVPSTDGYNLNKIMDFVKQYDNILTDIYSSYNSNKNTIDNFKDLFEYISGEPRDNSITGEGRLTSMDSKPLEENELSDFVTNQRIKTNNSNEEDSIENDEYEDEYEYDNLEPFKDENVQELC